MIIGIVGYAGDGKTLLSVIYTTHLIYGNPVMYKCNQILFYVFEKIPVKIQY